MQYAFKEGTLRRKFNLNIQHQFIYTKYHMFMKNSPPLWVYSIIQSGVITEQKQEQEC